MGGVGSTLVYRGGLVMGRTAVATSVDDIREAVGRLLSRARISEPPVDLTKVAAVQGVKEIRHREMRRTLGTLSNRSGRLRITLNKSQSHRARFTLAHEIAHTMLEPQLAPDAPVVLAERRPSGSTALERLCDQIATELLLPYDMFRDALGAGAPGIEHLERLARRFDASLQATARRTGEVSEAPVQVVIWGKHSERGLAVQMKSGRDYLTCAGALRFRSFTANRSSAIVRAFSAGETQLGEEVPLPEAPWNAYRCEARGYSSGSRRFVVAVVTPAEAGR